LPREPTMVTTERPTLSLDDGGALPTIASAGADNSSAAAASMEAGIFIGAAIAFGLAIAKGRDALASSGASC
jgi:hypothetical protein